MKWINKILLVLNIVWAILLLGAYISPGINPERIWIFSLLGLMYPLLLFGHLLFLLYWIFMDFKWSFISIIILLCGIPHINEFISFNAPKESNQKNSISVFSYNLGNGLQVYDKDKATRKSNRHKMVKFLKEQRGQDVLCFQEVGSYANKMLKETYNDHLNLHRLNKGTVIYSKHPIVDKGEIAFGTITNSCLWADVRINNDTVRIYSAHLQSNRISKDAEKVIDHPDLNDDKTWLDIRTIFSKFVKTHIKRSKQARMVKEHMDTSPHPVLLCGDLNDTPLTYTYRQLSLDMNDAYIEAGNGIGTTFNGSIPLLRIDYILSDPSFTAQKFEIHRNNLSDHYAISSRLLLP